VETVLHSFADNGTDGYDPTSALIAVKGSLYGTTGSGGAYGYGTVFSVDPKTGTETVAYSFSGGANDGSDPVGALLSVDGLLYGTTAQGGASSAGTIFKIDPTTNKETILYDFKSSPEDGADPLGALIRVNGVFYGTTIGGGPDGVGTIYSFNGKTETMLCSFRGDTYGASPNGGVVDINNILYGTTNTGGLNNRGGVFSFSLESRQEKIIYSFSDNNSDGIFPNATVISVNDQLYGTTTGGGDYGGGTVYSFNPTTGAENVIYSFCSKQNCVDGSQPDDPLVSVGGVFYGTANGGGTYNWGAVFSLDLKTKKEKVLHSFDDNGTDGAFPYTAVLSLKNKLYGTTLFGGSSTSCRDGCGTVFEIKP
jgi:uncharacterized repeat protein (TIGR03803 family)